MPQVLNEVVIDRGPSAYIGNIDLYIEHKLITSVQGDGTYVTAAASAALVDTNLNLLSCLLSDGVVIVSYM